MKTPLVCLLCLVVWLTGGVDAWAQATAQISGSVTDQSRGVLPGVTVTATQTQTRVIRSSVTDDTGSYVLTNLALLDLSTATRYKKRSWQAQSIFERG